MRLALVPLLALTSIALIPAAGGAAGPCRGQTPTGATAKIVADDEPGTRMRLRGTAFDAVTGKGLAGVTLYVYQTDAAGHYSENRGMDNRNPRLCGVLRTGADGGYVVETIRPADYATGGIEAHIHVEAYGGGVERQAFLLEFDAPVKPVKAGARVAAPAARATGASQPVYRLADGTLEVCRDLPIRR
jgi:hypothetical protein